MSHSKSYVDLFKIPFLIFILLLATVIFGGIQVKESFTTYIDEFEPIENALEAKRVDLYSDSVLLYRYLATESLTQASLIDKEIEESNHKCTMIDTRISTLHEKGLLSDDLHRSYLVSLKEHSKAENLKDELIGEHKQLLLNNDLENKNYTQTLQTYNEHFNNALVTLDTELINLELLKIETQNTINTIELVTLTLSFLFSLLFVILITRSLLKVKRDAVDPLEKIDQNTKAFVEGDFTTSIHSNSEKENVKELEDRMNTLFTYVKDTTSNSKKKQDFKEQFLKTEYHEILELLKNRANSSKATTMKDIKTNLRITHPTLISRLNYLKEHSYISISKNGRDKVVSLL